MHCFISYSSKDQEIADTIRGHLESRGVSCWIAPRDIPPGAVYADAIVDGIAAADSLVLVLSDHSNLSRHVQAEVERAFSSSKPVFPVRIRDVRPSKGLELFVSASQWIDALALPLDSKMNELASAILGLGKSGSTSTREEEEGDRIPEKRAALNNRLREVDIVSVACTLAETGATGLDFAPVQRFGRMVTVDPTVVEQAGAIKAAVKRYIQAPRNRRGLNLAVFGPPGTGKIFAIQEIIRSAELEPIVRIEVDLSSLRDPTEIIPAFRSVQDAALRGSTALLCVEGFDAPLSGIPFGWLQHLVRVMRDGEFADDGARRPLGQCVLCFLGTQTFTQDELKRAIGKPNCGTAVGEFLSIVDCCLDVPGINPSWPGDRIYMLNRALLLRAILQGQRRRVDSLLQCALLTVPKYYAGARSLEAIVRAAGPNDVGGTITGDSLPTDGELNRHVDAAWIRRALTA